MGRVVHKLPFALTIKMTSVQSNISWSITNILGPCDGLDRGNFTEWMESLNIELNDLCLFMGDFNFIWPLDIRNLPCGNIDDIIKFNGIISALALLEIRVKGRKYTWSNLHKHHCWSNWTGFSRRLNGFQSFQTQR